MRALSLIPLAALVACASDPGPPPDVAAFKAACDREAEATPAVRQAREWEASAEAAFHRDMAALERERASLAAQNSDTKATLLDLRAMKLLTNRSRGTADLNARMESYFCMRRTYEPARQQWETADTAYRNRFSGPSLSSGAWTVIRTGPGTALIFPPGR